MHKKTKKEINKLYYINYQNKELNYFNGIINDFNIMGKIDSFNLSDLGGPIMNSENFKVIGIINEFENKDTIGILIKSLIDEFYKSFYNKLNNKNNDILMLNKDNKKNDNNETKIDDINKNDEQNLESKMILSNKEEVKEGISNKIDNNTKIVVSNEEDNKKDKNNDSNENYIKSLIFCFLRIENFKKGFNES